jgi:hypothetical protein
MRLKPAIRNHLASVLCGEPASVGDGRETGRIGSEVGFEGRKRSGASSIMALRNGVICGILQHIQNRVVVRGLVNQAVGGEVAQVTGCTTSGHSVLDFHNGTEDGVGERQTRTTTRLYRIVDCRTKVAQQPGNADLLMRLRCVVRRPFLAEVIVSRMVPPLAVGHARSSHQRPSVGASS